MGRKATSLKSKGTSPIPLPLDGPIFYFLENPHALESSILGTEDIQQALNILQGNGSLSESTSVSSLMISDLCQALITAERDKVQLSALQSFKNAMVNSKKSRLSEETECIPPSLASSLYRLFLEWSLSEDTSIPLRRAIQSSLTVLDVKEEEIAREVLTSMWNPTPFWKNPLHTLDVACGNPFLLSILQESLFEDCLIFIHRQWIYPLLNSKTIENNNDNGDFVAEGVRLSNILKILLNSAATMTARIPSLSDFQSYVVRLMTCPAMPMEGFTTLGILYGKLHFRSTSLSADPREAANAAITTIQQLNDIQRASLSQFARLSMVQGIAATLESQSLTISVDDTSALEACWRYSLHSCQVATDPMVRWAAIKGLSTLASRWKQLAQTSDSLTSERQDPLIQETLQVVLQAWENPPLKKLGTAIPGVFTSLVNLLSEQQRNDLCCTVLNQPLTRKGRYLALEILLPYFPPGQSLQVESLLDGIGDRGPNTGPIADLWTKILGYSWEQQQLLSPSCVATDRLENWMSQWVPSLSRALVLGKLSRRKQVSSFCIVRIFDLMKQTESLQPYLGTTLVQLLNQIAALKAEPPAQSQTIAVVTESIADRVLWAHLELSRQINTLKGMETNVKEAIARHVPRERLYYAMENATSSLRLVACQALEAVVIQAYSETIQHEAEVWKNALPFSIKTTDGKEYIPSLLQYLTQFLDRFSALESLSARSNEPNILPKFYDFVANFLLKELFLRQSAYPGTVADKENFSLLLLESILSFVLQDQTYTSDNCVVRSGAIFSRKRTIAEQTTMSALLRAILDQEVFGALFSLLHSIWDNTRNVAFRTLSKLVMAAQSQEACLPNAYCAADEIKAWKARGIYLASSPRQREADTGARILAFLYMTQTGEKNRLHFAKELVNLLVIRLEAMKQSLQTILRESGSEDVASLDIGKNLPMAHGILRGLYLITEYERRQKIPSPNSREQDGMSELYSELIVVCCEAIQLSLNVVADVRDGEILDGMDELTLESRKDAPKNKGVKSFTPLNVNAGAIGANGTFSRLSSSVDEGKLAIQRVVIGTWLLTKETCSSVSAIISTEHFDPPPELVLRVGTLLISTLTSLKHAGAAFAARDSLQQIATTCVLSKNSELREIPELWTQRLLDELSSPERVRDSTLRRSTGYALGFMALMRSEVAGNSSASCKRILKDLIVYALPAEQKARSTLESLNILRGRPGDVSQVFASATTDMVDSFFLPDAKYEPKCRVHALNVMRLIILDAPLAKVVGPIVGDAIMCALIGYNDQSWAVRNSATMVFSAAMLRVVDADKNASNTDKTSSQAITISELFHRYPSLSTFLPSMMEQCLDENNETGRSQLFPILLLLSRIQAVSNSGGVAASLALTYPPMIFKALSSEDLVVRAAAARSLANVCSEDIESSSSALAFLRGCSSVLGSCLESRLRNWNQVDGVLLCMEALILSSEVCLKSMLEVGFYEGLLRVVLDLDSSKEFPPSSRASAIRILLLPDDIELKGRLYELCQRVVSEDKIERTVGGATLYAESSRAIIKILESGLWDAYTMKDLEKSVDDLKQVLCSNFLDVRLAGAKAFKKSIYDNIDRVLQGKDRSVSSRETLTKLAIALLECTQNELQYGIHNSTNLGAHIPTVRRLSRCLLECYYAIPSNSKPTLLSTNELLWNVAMNMINLEQFLDDTQSKSCNGETYLSGNAAELMAIAIAPHLTPDSVPSESKVSTFLKVVERLNNPLASWRSRYSAALGVETSQVLRLDLKRQQTKVLRVVLEMLQDSDPDVRARAARAASQVTINGLEHTLQPNDALCRLYLLAFKKGMDFANVQLVVYELSQFFIENCRFLTSTLPQLDIELNAVTQSTDIPAPANSSSNRRIFEAEDPNPYNERLLTNQLATITMLQLQPLERPDSSKECSELVELLLFSLELLEKRQCLGGTVNDLTRHPSVFVALYGLICSIAAHIYLGVIKPSNEDSVKRLAQEVTKRQEATIHPEIRTVLVCMANMQKGDPVTKKALNEALFLVGKGIPSDEEK